MSSRSAAKTTLQSSRNFFEGVFETLEGGMEINHPFSFLFVMEWHLLPRVYLVQFLKLSDNINFVFFENCFYYLNLVFSIF